mmetsp:Transcript_8162/g.12609  ORF Transcript_8162/g.12609 Transcript_8162/m.12609 type:complete len:232 (-) Transcript_8162:271-966(-)
MRRICVGVVKTFVDQNLVDQIGIDLFQGGINNVTLEEELPASSNRYIGCDNNTALCSRNALSQGLGRKASKHDRMHGTETGTRQHCHCQFWNHGHVDSYNISFLDALALESIGNLGNLPQQFRVGNFSHIGGFVALPNHGDSVAICNSMAIDCVVANVQFSTRKPPHVSFFEITRQCRKRKIRVPIQHFLGLVCPEIILETFLVYFFVFIQRGGRDTAWNVTRSSRDRWVF